MSNIGSGTAGQVFTATTSGPTLSTATYPLVAGTSGTLLISNGTNIINTTSTYPTTNAVSTLLYASSANVMGALATANNGILNTSSSGVPSITASPTIGVNSGATTVTIASNSQTALAFDNGVAHGTIPLIDLYHDAATVATDYAYELDFNAQNSTPAKKTFASIQGQVSVNTAASEMGTLLVNTINAGSSQVNIQVGNNLGQYRGTATNTAPPAGFIGERITAQATAVATTTNIAKTITSINLTAGIWDISGSCAAVATGGTALMFQNLCGISTVNNTLGSNFGIDYNDMASSAVFAVMGQNAPLVRAVLSTTTTYYLVVTNQYTSTTCPTNAIISATRVG